MAVEDQGTGSVDTLGIADSCFAVFSSKGNRSYQEDRFGCWQNDAGHLFAVVVDGAGGHGGGSEAAEAAVNAAASAWKSNGNCIIDGADFLGNYMEAAHDAVRAESNRIARSARAAVVALVVDGVEVHWVHAGDCRLYRVAGNSIIERTRDDSVVQVLFENGEISEDEMGSHPDQNRLLQSLGGDDPPTPRFGSAKLDSCEVFLLCSDGFWENQSKDEIIRLVQVAEKNRDEAIEAAVNEAVRRAENKADNTTALIVRLDSIEDLRCSEKRGSLLWFLFSLVLLLAIIFFMVQILSKTGELGTETCEGEMGQSWVMRNSLI